MSRFGPKECSEARSNRVHRWKTINLSINFQRKCLKFNNNKAKTYPLVQQQKSKIFSSASSSSSVSKSPGEGGAFQNTAELGLKRIRSARPVFFINIRSDIRRCVCPSLLPNIYEPQAKTSEDNGWPQVALDQNIFFAIFRRIFITAVSFH